MSNRTGTDVREAPSRDRDSDWKHTFPDVGQLLTIVAALVGPLYVFGLFALEQQLERRYSIDWSTAWYAASLAPRTVVAVQGVQILLSKSTVLVLMMNLLVPIAAMLLTIARMDDSKVQSQLEQLRHQPLRTRLNSFRNRIWLRKRVLSWTRRHLPTASRRRRILAVVMRSTSIGSRGDRLLSLVQRILLYCMALLVTAFIALTVLSGLLGIGIPLKFAAIDVGLCGVLSITIMIRPHAGKLPRFFQSTQIFLSLLLLYVAALVPAFWYEVEQGNLLLPSVTIDTKDDTSVFGVLLTHSDGLWYVVRHGELLPIPDNAVHDNGADAITVSLTPQPHKRNVPTAVPGLRR